MAAWFESPDVREGSDRCLSKYYAIERPRELNQRISCTWCYSHDSNRPIPSGLIHFRVSTSYGPGLVFEAERKSVRRGSHLRVERAAAKGNVSHRAVPLLTHFLASCVPQTYDEAAHPSDITLDWSECDAQFCDYVEMATAVTITCAGERLSPCPWRIVN